MAADRRDAWRATPDDVEPTVLILGGFLTSPPLYRRMHRRLMERGAADVVVASIWLPDWLLVTTRGMGPILTRSGRALLHASDVANASPRSRGAPLLVVGHSAGGIAARAHRRSPAWRGGPDRGHRDARHAASRQPDGPRRPAAR